MGTDFKEQGKLSDPILNRKFKRVKPSDDLSGKPGKIKEIDRKEARKKKKQMRKNKKK